jgi:hypothetical protein
MIKRLDDDGLMAIQKGCEEHFGDKGSSESEFREEVKS